MTSARVPPMSTAPLDPSVDASHPVIPRRSLWTAIRRGLGRRCPNCGEKTLFIGYLTLRSPCPNCSLDTQRYRADDAPAYFTIAIVGHIVVPLLLLTDKLYAPSTLMQLSIWLPLTLALTLWILPRAKGALIGINWATEAGG